MPRILTQVSKLLSLFLKASSSDTEVDACPSPLHACASAISSALNHGVPSTTYRESTPRAISRSRLSRLQVALHPFIDDAQAHPLVTTLTLLVSLSLLTTFTGCEASVAPEVGPTCNHRLVFRCPCSSRHHLSHPPTRLSLFLQSAAHIHSSTPTLLVSI